MVERCREEEARGGGKGNWRRRRAAGRDWRSIFAGAAGCGVSGSSRRCPALVELLWGELGGGQERKARVRFLSFDRTLASRGPLLL